MPARLDPLAGKRIARPGFHACRSRRGRSRCARGFVRTQQDVIVLAAKLFFGRAPRTQLLHFIENEHAGHDDHAQSQ